MGAAHISIHALREEGDHLRQNSIPSRIGISIHALREEGDGRDQGHQRDRHISIHALREEGDLRVPHLPHQAGISIHTLREEGDVLSQDVLSSDLLFLSTPSARRATVRLDLCHVRWVISIHALREEGDIAAIAAGAAGLDFYPRPPRGGRQV